MEYRILTAIERERSEQDNKTLDKCFPSSLGLEAPRPNFDEMRDCLIFFKSVAFRSSDPQLEHNHRDSHLGFSWSMNVHTMLPRMIETVKAQQAHQMETDAPESERFIMNPVFREKTPSIFYWLIGTQNAIEYVKRIRDQFPNQNFSSYLEDLKTPGHRLKTMISNLVSVPNGSRFELNYNLISSILKKQKKDLLDSINGFDSRAKISSNELRAGVPLSQQIADPQFTFAKLIGCDPNLVKELSPSPITNFPPHSTVDLMPELNKSNLIANDDIKQLISKEYRIAEAVPHSNFKLRYCFQHLRAVGRNASHSLAGAISYNGRILIYAEKSESGKPKNYLISQKDFNSNPIELCKDGKDCDIVWHSKAHYSSDFDPHYMGMRPIETPFVTYRGIRLAATPLFQMLREGKLTRVCQSDLGFQRYAYDEVKIKCGGAINIADFFKQVRQASETLSVDRIESNKKIFLDSAERNLHSLAAANLAKVIQANANEILNHSSTAKNLEAMIALGTPSNANAGVEEIAKFKEMLTAKEHKLPSMSDIAELLIVKGKTTAEILADIDARYSRLDGQLKKASETKYQSADVSLIDSQLGELENTKSRPNRNRRR